MSIIYTYYIDHLEVICGNPNSRDDKISLKVPSEAAKALYLQISNCPPKDPAKFALRLLSVFFTDEELAESNCTDAKGRKLLDQSILWGIKCKCMMLLILYVIIIYYFIIGQTNYKFPADKQEEDSRWQMIVQKSLNTKCRGCRKKLKNTEKSQENIED